MRVQEVDPLRAAAIALSPFDGRHTDPTPPLLVSAVEDDLDFGFVIKRRQGVAVERFLSLGNEDDDCCGVRLRRAGRRVHCSGSSDRPSASPRSRRVFLPAPP